LVALLGCGSSAPYAKTEARGMLPARWIDPASGSQPVPFSFEQESDTAGVMFTTLGNGGEHFRGRYVRVEKSTQGRFVTEIYDGWSAPEWEVWQHEPDGDWTETASSTGDFAHFYSGRVVASLRGSEGHSMRCRFSLDHPEGGLLAGGEGDCQISDGGQVSLDF
jgi:hypothetical protein